MSLLCLQYTISISKSSDFACMPAPILLKIVPYDFEWGGRLKSETDLIIFESISIVVQTLFISIITVRAGYIFKGNLK